VTALPLRSGYTDAMRMLKLTGSAWVVIIAVLASSAGMAQRARACKCLEPNVESSYNRSSDVVSVEILRQYANGSTRTFAARVLRTFKGCLKPGQNILLNTSTSSASCGVTLDNRRQYLINGTSSGRQGNQPVLSIGSCSYNRELTTLSELDREFLDGRNVCCGDTCACASGQAPAKCLVDPCSVAPACADGKCQANYCGGCHAEFYDTNGYAVCEEPRACTQDGDCPSDDWCRQAQPVNPSDPATYACVSFSGDGERCGGFRPAWTFERCEPSLVCDVPDGTADAQGICGLPCKISLDCPADQYCGGDHICSADSTCENDADCNASGNTYAHSECVGSGVCSDNKCGWKCGNAQCVDLLGVDFGSCKKLLGAGLVGGKCSAIGGCDARGYKLFADVSGCQQACFATVKLAQ
jgi:hypothetical protein